MEEILDPEFLKKEAWNVQAILTLDYQERVWSKLTDAQKIDYVAKARAEREEHNPQIDS